MNVVAVRRDVPWNVSLLLLAIVASGVTAALVVSPALWWTTLAMTGLVLYGWSRASSRPAPDDDLDPPELPAATRRIVRETFDALPVGEGAGLLRSIVQPARSLFAQARSNLSLTPALLRDVAELVEVSCTSAGELARLEILRARDAGAMETSERRALSVDITASSDLLRRRLADAGATLAKLYLQSVEHGTASSDRVAELAAELGAEIALRRRASAEIEALLK